MALVLGIVSTRFFQSSALGYVMAGVVLGPIGLNYLVPGHGFGPLFGEIGFIMLMFYLGLELNLRKFKETGGVSVILAIAQMATAFVGGFVVAKLLGFGDLEAIALGAMLVATSTVIVAKFLIDRGIIERVDSRIALSVLMLQDFFAIFVLVFLTSLSAQKAFNSIVLNALIFMVGTFFIVSKVSRHVLNFLNSLGYGNTMFFYAFGVGAVSSYAGVLLGLSSALGAYFAGFALAETAFGERIKRELGFLREFFVLFFFVNFGSFIFYDETLRQAALPSLSALLPLVGVTIALAAVYVLGSFAAFLLAGTLLGIDKYVVGNVATLLIPLGEFVILIATAMKPLLPAKAFSDIVTIAFLLILSTSAATPFFFTNSRRLTDLFFSLLPRRVSKALGRTGAGLVHLERLAVAGVGRSKALSSIRAMAQNLLVAFAVVYLSVLLGEQAFSGSGLAGLPRDLSAGFFALLLVIWPLYKFVAELKYLVEQVSQQVIHSAFPAVRRSTLLVEDEVADVFTGFILTALGVMGTVVFYYSLPETPVFLVIPIAYTILALMHLSRAFYSLAEQFESVGDVEERPALLESTDEEFRRLSKEFEENSGSFRQLHLERERTREKMRQAMRQGNLRQVRTLLTHLKRKESKLLGEVTEARREEKSLFSLVRSLDTKKAFEHYLLGRHAKKRK